MSELARADTSCSVSSLPTCATLYPAQPFDYSVCLLLLSCHQDSELSYRSGSENGIWFSVGLRAVRIASGSPVLYVLPHTYCAPLCTVCVPRECASRAVVTACLWCSVRPICVQQHAVAVRPATLCVTASATPQFYLPLFLAGAVVDLPRFPPHPISILQSFAVLIGPTASSRVYDSFSALKIGASPPSLYVPWGRLLCHVPD